MIHSKEVEPINRLFYVTMFFLSFLWIAAASAGADTDPSMPNQESQLDKPQQDKHNGQNAPESTEKAPVLKTQKERVNYAIGVNLIGNFKQQGIDIDLNLVIKGMQDALSGAKLLLDDAELRKATMVYQSEVRRRQAEARAASQETGKKAGEKPLK